MGGCSTTVHTLTLTLSRVRERGPILEERMKCPKLGLVHAGSPLRLTKSDCRRFVHYGYI